MEAWEKDNTLDGTAKEFWADGAVTYLVITGFGVLRVTSCDIYMYTYVCLCVQLATKLPTLSQENEHQRKSQKILLNLCREIHWNYLCFSSCVNMHALYVHQESSEVLSCLYTCLGSLRNDVETDSECARAGREHCDRTYNNLRTFWQNLSHLLGTLSRWPHP